MASDDGALAAGGFSAWLAGMRVALEGRADSDVPCGTCTACCTSSQFVHIAPDETDALAHIPQALLFPAPRLPAGHVLLGYDERGHCPMLVGGRCSIYEHRPRTCRTYDCRVLPAAGVALVEEERAPIARQASRWRFSFPADADQDELSAVRAAAAFLREHPDALPHDRPPGGTELAVLAVAVHDLFLPGAGGTPSAEVVRAALARRAASKRARDVPASSSVPGCGDDD
jgi:hypothetical protein